MNYKSKILAVILAVAVLALGVASLVTLQGLRGELKSLESTQLRVADTETNWEGYAWIQVPLITGEETHVELYLISEGLILYRVMEGTGNFPISISTKDLTEGKNTLTIREEVSE